MNFFRQLIMLSGLVAALAFSSVLADDYNFDNIIRTCHEANRKAITMSESDPTGIENSKNAAVLVSCKILQDAYSKRYQTGKDGLKEAAYQALERGTIVEKIEAGRSNKGSQLAVVRRAI